MKLTQVKDPDKNKSEYAVDLKRLPDYQLQEIYERQAKIIRNKSLINKLPDKGLKLIEKNKAIETELDVRKRATDEIISNISELKITGEQEASNVSLSSSCSSLSQEGTFASNSVPDSGLTLEKFAINRTNKFDQIEKSTRFIPSHSSECKESKKRYEEKDLSSACEPSKKFDIKQVPLQEVVKLRGRETLYIKSLEIKEAQDKLVSMEFSSTERGSTGLCYTPMNYRSAAKESDESDHEDVEDHGLVDEDEDDRRGTITFTVQD